MKYFPQSINQSIKQHINQIKRMTDVCQICVEELNASSRKKVSCEYCAFDACAKCCKTYILGETTAKCMNGSCDKEWTRQFLTKTFGSTFMNSKLKTHREQILFDKERALLPATQPIVENINAIERMKEEIIKINEEKSRLEQRKYNIINQMHRVERGLDVARERSVFVKSCPDSTCRGYLSSQWKCGLCEMWACPDCHEIKGISRDAEHTCNPDNVATAQLLATDTKPCPKCRTGIYKIDGCDQMWCTQCHTAFSWKSGNIENNIHNPHYYQWLRSQSATGEIPRNPNEGNPNHCGPDVLSHQTLYQITRILDGRHEGKSNELVQEMKRLLSRIIQNTIHLNHVELGATGRFKNVDYQLTNQDLRVKYMRQKIDEAQFRVLLQRSEKKEEKRREIRNVLQVLDTTVTDIIFRFKHQTETCAPNSINTTILEEIKPIVDYVNGHLEEIEQTYSSKNKIRITTELSFE